MDANEEIIRIIGLLYGRCEVVRLGIRTEGPTQKGLIDQVRAVGKRGLHTRKPW
jgi:hypothetical protein